jgi:hypothetical protein
MPVVEWAVEECKRRGCTDNHKIGAICAAIGRRMHEGVSANQTRFDVDQALTAMNFPPVTVDDSIPLTEPTTLL